MELETRLLEMQKKYESYGRTGELPKIRAAYDFAFEAHKGQKRLNGEPYVTPSLSVA